MRARQPRGWSWSECLDILISPASSFTLSLQQPVSRVGHPLSAGLKSSCFFCLSLVHCCCRNAGPSPVKAFALHGVCDDGDGERRANVKGSFSQGEASKEISQKRRSDVKACRGMKCAVSNQKHQNCSHAQATKVSG